MFSTRCRCQPHRGEAISLEKFRFGEPDTLKDCADNLIYFAATTALCGLARLDSADGRSPLMRLQG